MSEQRTIVAFESDKVSIRGPRVDGTYVISFDVGEHMRERISDLLKLPNDRVLQVGVLVK